MASNRKVLKLAGSTLANVAALTGADAIEARELLCTTDTGTLILGTGGGNYRMIGAVLSGTTAERNLATPTEGQLFLDTTETVLYLGDGTQWVKAAMGASDVDLSTLVEKVASATAGNLPQLTADGAIEDSGVAAANVMQKVASASADNIAALDANGNVVDGGIDKADLQQKLASATAGNVLTADANGFMQDSGTALADVQTKLTGATQGNLLAVDANGFMADAGFKLDDNGSAATDIWSAQKVADAITSAVNGLSWQAPVKGEATAPGATPAAGDRYLVKATATGDFAGKEGKIAEYDGTAWKFVDPVDGMAVFLEDTDHQMAFNGTDWVDISAGFTYSAGNGIDITNNAISVAAKTDGGLVVDNNGVAVDVDTTSVVLDASGHVAVKVKANDALNVDATDGLNVAIDGDSIVLDSNNALSVNDLDFGTF